MGKHKLLVIDSDPDTRKMLEIYFKGHGYEVETIAEDGNAIEVVEQMLPDVILMSVRTVADSISSRSQLRQDGNKIISLIPFVILTRKFELQQFSVGDATRYDSFIGNPYDIDNLKTLIEEQVSRFKKMKHSKETSWHSPNGYRMLIVYPDIDVSTILAIYFTGQGYDVRLASSGEDGLTIMEKFIPNIILIENNITTSDGSDVIRTIRITPRTRHIPFIFFTDLYERKDTIIGLELGADDEITKPVDVKELKLRIEDSITSADRLLKQFQKRRKQND